MLAVIACEPARSRANGFAGLAAGNGQRSALTKFPAISLFCLHRGSARYDARFERLAGRYKLFNFHGLRDRSG